MGASEFGVYGTGKTAAEAFRNAVEEADAEFGHRQGYSGTINSKRSFKEVSVPSGKDLSTFLQELADDDNHFSQDKYGPAGCVKVSDDQWFFFGIAPC